jgi:2-dehydro-3-deoxygalactonokinase
MTDHFAILNMGTTNTRITLTDSNGHVTASATAAFGVKDRAASGDRNVLVIGLRELLKEAAQKGGVEKSRIAFMIGSGMVTSEIGLVEIPHCLAPASVQDLSARTSRRRMPEILPCPILFIPGIKNRVEHLSMETLEQMDFMRGEETQVFGALDHYQIQPPVTFMFLSSHTKLVDVDENQRITRSYTTLSGQIFDAFRYHSLLASSLPKHPPTPKAVTDKALFAGVEAGLKTGILRGSLMVRFMDTLIQTTPEERFSFLEGVIAASDVLAIKGNYPWLRQKMAVLGDPVRAAAYKEVFANYLDDSREWTYLGESSMVDSTIQGALKIARLQPHRP